MNAALEPITLDQVVERATPEQRRYLVAKLLAKESRSSSIHVQDDRGESIGVFIPRFESRASIPPPSTVANHIQIHNGIESFDDGISFEEMRTRLGLPEVRLEKQ